MYERIFPYVHHPCYFYGLSVVRPLVRLYLRLELYERISFAYIVHDRTTLYVRYFDHSLNGIYFVSFIHPEA